MSEATPRGHPSVDIDEPVSAEIPARLLGQASPDIRNQQLLTHLMTRYSKTKIPLEVSFRDLIPLSRGAGREAHLIHPYPAKLLPQIPFFLITNDALPYSKGTVLDPFCGSGTVLLESSLAGRKSVGIDSNPLSCLISRVKTAPPCTAKVQHALRRVLSRAPLVESAPPPDVVNIDYWFHPHTIEQLSRLAGAIHRTRDEQVREFLLVCLSVTVRKVCLADPRVSVPVRLKASQYPPGHWLALRTAKLLGQLRVRNAFKVFEESVLVNLKRLPETFRERNPTATVMQADTRTLDARILPPIDLIVTSPPYLGAQKYVRATSLSLGWLGLASSRGLRALEDQCIGKEHLLKAERSTLTWSGIPAADRHLARLFRLNPTRACMAAIYLNDMRETVTTLKAALRPKGTLALVSSGNDVCGEEFPTHQYLREICIGLGLEERLRLVDTIRSRGLMTRRNRTASVITREWVLLFEKR